MYAVVRRYNGASALVDAMKNSASEVEQLLRAVPGFVAYYAVQAGDGLATVTICEDRAGTQESSRRAAEWVKTNVPNAGVAAPEITEGETFFNF